MINSPQVSVVLGSYNRLPFLKLTIESLRKELEGISYEIIVVDGGSSDKSSQWLIQQKDIITIVQHNRGVWAGKNIVRQSWGYFMNLAFKAAQGKYICMVSDDCLIVPGAIKNGYELFEQKIGQNEKIGALAFYWRDWPNQIKYKVGLTLGDNMFVNHGMYLRQGLEDVGYIDEDSYVFYCADGDLILKMLTKGYICIDSPNSFIEHFAHTNTQVRATNYATHQTDWLNYLEKWSNLYYDKEKNNTGGWIEKEYTDPYKTADQYKIYYRRSVFSKKIKLIRNKILMKLSSKSN